MKNTIEDTKPDYYRVLKESSAGWIDNNNDYLPFLDYFLSIVLKDYREFNERLSLVNQTDLPVDKLILKMLRQALQPLSIKEINNLIPQYSEVTIRRALRKLQEDNKVNKLGKARATKYGLKI